MGRSRHLQTSNLPKSLNPIIFLPPTPSTLVQSSTGGALGPTMTTLGPKRGIYLKDNPLTFTWRQLTGQNDVILNKKSDGRQVPLASLCCPTEACVDGFSPELCLCGAGSLWRREFGSCCRSLVMRFRVIKESIQMQDLHSKDSCRKVYTRGEGCLCQVYINAVDEQL